MFLSFFKQLALFFIIILINACSTPYQKSGLTGGYKEYYLGDNTVKVTARGNAFTSLEKVQNIVLVRSAELCNITDDVIEVISSNSRFKTNLYSTPSQPVTTYGSNQTSTVYYGGSTGTISKPRAEIIFKCREYSELNTTESELEKSSEYGVKYFSAKKVLQYIKPTLE